MPAMLKRILGLVVSVCLFALCGCGAPAGTGPEDSVGVVEVELTMVPTGITCVSLFVAMTGVPTIEQRFTVVAGQASTLTMTALPIGNGTLTGKAYPTACSGVTSSLQPLWFSDPVPVVLTPGQSTPVALTLRQQASVAVAVDFCATPPCSTLTLATAAATVTELAATKDRIFFSDGSAIYSVPTLGGTASIFNAADAASANTSPRLGLSVDATSIYWTRLAVTGNMELAKTPLAGGATTVLVSGDLGGFQQAAGDLIYYLTTGRTGINSLPIVGTGQPRILVSTGAALETTGSVQPYVVNGAALYFMTPTSINVVSSAGGSQTTLYTALTGERFSAIATDGAQLYFASSTSNTSTIKRVPLTGGPATTFASDPASRIQRLVVDAAGAYWMTRNQLATGACSTQVERRLASSTTTQLLANIPAVCSNDMVADAGALYVAAGQQVLRVPK